MCTVKHQVFTMMCYLKENDQRRQLEEKRRKREEAKKAAEEAKRKKLAAKGIEAAAEPEEPKEETCIIDNLLKEIRTGTSLRKTGRQSVHKRRRSQLNKEDIEKLNEIVGKAASSPRKSPSTAKEPQFTFPPVSEETESEHGKENGTRVPSASSQTVNNVRESENGESIREGSSHGATISSTGTEVPSGSSQTVNNVRERENGESISGHGASSTIAPVVNGEGKPLLDHLQHNGGTTPVTDHTNPRIGDTAASKSPSLPTSPANDSSASNAQTRHRPDKELPLTDSCRSLEEREPSESSSQIMVSVTGSKRNRQHYHNCCSIGLGVML